MGDCGIMNLTVLNWLDHSAVSFAEKNAFSDKESTVTFAQLNAYTKSIGTYLARRVKPGSPVVVMSGRHVLTPACYLGVVRAGCFYAPMDATMPAARLNQILGVIKADTMLVDREHAELAKTLDFSGDILVMGDIMETPPEDELLEKATSRLVGTSPLYVIFTSGSTGVPKGVITSHESLMCYIDAVSEVLELNDTDILGNQSPLDYIAAIRDI